MTMYIISVLCIVGQYNATPKKESSFQFLPESSPFGQQGKVIINDNSTDEWMDCRRMNE